MIQLEVWGPYALFSRPELHVERCSYDVPTPSAARGLVEAIYFHPGLQWHIRRIYVLNPIKFTNIRRNEVKSKIHAPDVHRAMQGNGKPLYLSASQQIAQRASMVLQDVHYVIEAEFTMTDRAAPSDNPGKFQDIETFVVRLEFASPGGRHPHGWRGWQKQLLALCRHYESLSRSNGYRLLD